MENQAYNKLKDYVQRFPEKIVLVLGAEFFEKVPKRTKVLKNLIDFVKSQYLDEKEKIDQLFSGYSIDQIANKSDRYIQKYQLELFGYCQYLMEELDEENTIYEGFWQKLKKQNQDYGISSLVKKVVEESNIRKIVSTSYVQVSTKTLKLLRDADFIYQDRGPSNFSRGRTRLLDRKNHKFFFNPFLGIGKSQPTIFSERDFYAHISGHTYHRFISFWEEEIMVFLGFKNFDPNLELLLEFLSKNEQKRLYSHFVVPVWESAYEQKWIEGYSGVKVVNKWNQEERDKTNSVFAQICLWSKDTKNNNCIGFLSPFELDWEGFNYLSHNLSDNPPEIELHPLIGNILTEYQECSQRLNWASKKINFEKGLYQNRFDYDLAWEFIKEKNSLLKAAVHKLKGGIVFIFNHLRYVFYEIAGNFIHLGITALQKVLFSINQTLPMSFIPDHIIPDKVEGIRADLFNNFPSFRTVNGNVNFDSKYFIKCGCTIEGEKHELFLPMEEGIAIFRGVDILMDGVKVWVVSQLVWNFVDSPHDKLVNTISNFWNNPQIQIQFLENSFGEREYFFKEEYRWEVEYQNFLNTELKMEEWEIEEKESSFEKSEWS